MTYGMRATGPGTEPVSGRGASPDAGARQDPAAGPDARAGKDRSAPPEGWPAAYPDGYPQTTFDRLVAEQARRTPDALAVAQWDDRLTYGELAARARALAADLRRSGVGPETRVAICAPRTPAMLVAVLGVLMSGGCYVPLDPAHPQARRRAIAADAGAALVVGPEEGAIPIPGPGADGPEPDSRAVPDSLAHVLYTSGSTGRPKGVLTTHRNIVDFVTSCARFTGAGPATRTFGFSALGFDAATMDYFVPLATGGSVQLLGEQDRDDPTRLLRFAAEHGVTWGFITPAVLALLDPDDVPDWRLVMCGGEVVAPRLARRWSAAGRRFWHVYGPTETSVLALAVELTGEGDGPLPLGRPLPRHTAHVVDGELLLGGPGLARGYLDRPGLTAARFVPDPFSAEPGARLYRTGDLARIRADGQVEFLGRDDGQIKVRGQRIETGEIEAALRAQPGVGQVAVVTLDGPAGTELVAFVTPAGAPADLLERAADRLTPAMLPSRLLRLDDLPRNDSAKIDRARLRDLARRDREETSRHAGDGSSGRPLLPYEGRVAAIWHRLLGHAPAPGTAFTAAGGNSISAMRLVNALRAELGRDVAVEDVFTGRTLAGIAERVAKAGELTGPELTTGNPPTLSPPQRRLLFTDQLAPDLAPYNIPLAQRLRGPLDMGALRAALAAVAARHEILRWRFPDRDGVPYAVCDPPGAVPLAEVDVTEGELGARLAADGRTPFDTAAAPPWRATLYRLAPGDHVLALTFHHVVFDGWSQRVLYDDLARAYRGLPLTGPPTGPDSERAAAPDTAPASERPAPPDTAPDGERPAPPEAAPVAAPPASYADYAAWRERRDRVRGEADAAWWLEHLRGAPTVVDLPRDRPRPAVATYRGAEATIALPPDADASVTRLAAALGTTPASVLLAAFGQLLRRLTDSPQAVIGAVVADRRLAAFDEQIGFFIDMVPVLLSVDDDLPFAGHVRRAAAELLDATAHPAAPVEVLVDRLGLARETSRAPLVQIMFNVLNFAEPELELPGLTAETVTVDKPGSPFDMTVYVLPRDGRLAVDVLYNPDLFAAQRIGALLAGYAAVVAAFAADPDAAVAGVAPDLPCSASPPPGAMTVLAADDAFAGGAAGDGAAEAAVTAIWGEVLGRDGIQPTDNFFDVGGTSLALIAVRARLVARFGREVKAVDLFRYPTPRSLAAFLDGSAAAPEPDQLHRRVAARRERAARRARRLPTGPTENE